MATSCYLTEVFGLYAALIDADLLGLQRCKHGNFSNHSPTPLFLRG
jgi:hypothetical protein